MSKIAAPRQRHHRRCLNLKLKALGWCLGGSAAAGAGVLGGLWGYGLKTFAKGDIAELKLPGDDLLKERGYEKTTNLQVCIDCNATPEEIWPFLIQMGQRQAGFYSFSRLERLFTFHIYNTFRIVPAWQKREPGEFLYYHQAGIGSEIIEVKEGEYLLTVSDSRKPPSDPQAIAFIPPFGLKDFAWTWHFYLVPQGDNKTVILSRCESAWEPHDPVRSALITLFLGTPSVVMMRGFLTILRNCAEGKYPEYTAVERVLRKFS